MSLSAATTLPAWARFITVTGRNSTCGQPAVSLSINSLLRFSKS